MKTALFTGDWHCGHFGGLTPPEYQFSPKSKDPSRAKLASVQSALWDFYVSRVDEMKPQVIVLNGDAIDGKGDKSGGTELISTDRRVQCEMAAQAIRRSGAVSRLLLYGTGYHVGDDEDWEAVLADIVGAEIGSHEFPEIEGVVFDVRHHMGSSAHAYLRGTPLKKEAQQAALWYRRGLIPFASWLVRNHVHWYEHIEDGDYGHMVTCPALQWDTKFGKRRCGGTIDLGLLQFDCEDGYAEMTAHLIDMDDYKIKTVKL